MADSEHVVTDERQAYAVLDHHHARLLGCPASDLRRAGWTVITARDDADPMALLFGRRSLLRLIVPTADESVYGASAGVPHAGVVTVVPELRRPVAALLNALPPADLFTPEGLAAMDALLRGLVAAEVTPLPLAHQQIRFTYRGGFRPYLGPWLDWLEPLDETQEVDPRALSLLARFARGVYVVRQMGAIVAWAGMRAPSPHVWEVEARTEVAALRRHGLGQAVASRATRAVLAAGRLPITVHPAQRGEAVALADALGYRRYADSLHYLALR